MASNYTVKYSSPVARRLEVRNAAHYENCGGGGSCAVNFAHARLTRKAMSPLAFILRSVSASDG